MQMVGDTTYGKPNGMYVLMYPGSNSDYQAYNKGNYDKLQWVFLPIAFFNQNSRGESIPWDGFVPDNYRPDDLYHDFGVEESDIKACLTHLVSGTWPALPSATQQSRDIGLIRKKINLVMAAIPCRSTVFSGNPIFFSIFSWKIWNIG